MDEHTIVGNILQIVRDFMQPHTGILFVVPVARTYGVPKAKSAAKKK
jgi:hypothetical protein